MNGEYAVYKREPDGSAGDLIWNFTSLEISLSWSGLSKFTLEGVSVETVPLNAGDSVIFYRNGEFFLGGIIQEITVDCPEPSNGVKYWTANGKDDTLMLSWRQVLADLLEPTFEKNAYDQSEDYAYNRIIHYIENSIGNGTLKERRFSGKLILPSRDEIGAFALSAYRSKGLDKALSEIGKTDELYPYLVRDDHNGEYRIRFRLSRDKTDDIVIAPEFGNVTAWSKTEKLPDYNAVWVVSGDYSEGRLYVYSEDTESVKKYGRIEQIISRTDLVPTGDADVENPLTEDDVLRLLEQEADTQLKGHGQKTTWSIEAAETNKMAFMDNWRIGDQVTCVIDGECFESRITEAKITYQKGIETVVPTVGDMDRGLFGRLFDLIQGLDDRITNKENA